MGETQIDGGETLEPAAALAIGDVDMFGPPPIIPGEKPAEYLETKNRVLATIKPVDFIEEMLTRDVIDLFWEILRLRRLKAGLLRVSASKGIREILTSMLYEDANVIAGCWQGGSPDSRAQVSAIFESLGITDGEVMGQTLSIIIESIETIDRMTANAEARRNNALREIDRHRASLGAAVRAAMTNIEDASYTDVESGHTTEPV
jgi:hypothetical protein